MDAKTILANPIMLSLELVAVFVFLLVAVLIATENGVTPWKAAAVSVIASIISVLCLTFSYEILRAESLNKKYSKKAPGGMMLPPNIMTSPGPNY